MEVSNPDKVIFAQAGFTKRDLVAHYELVADRMLPWLVGRPTSLERFPNGVDKKGFMQKNASAHFPASIVRFEVERREGGVTTYPVLTEADDVVYLANQGTITFHTWTSTVDRPDHPDWFLLDLDPTEGDVESVRQATRLTRTVLARFGLDALAVATGSKGFHVRVPIVADRSFDDVALAGRAAAGLVAAADPELATVEFLKRDRKGRVFVDWLRNGPIATSVVPWSLRPRGTASVAVPLDWSELDQAQPDGWTLGRIDDRLALDLPPPEPSRLPVDEIVAAARQAGVDLDTTIDRFGRKR
jgi:bifunctional non-homologous end joining protein LigD